MKTRDPYVIDTSNMAPHLFGNECSLLCSRDIGGSCADHAHMPACFFKRILWSIYDHCMGRFAKTNSVLAKSGLHSSTGFWSNAANNGSSRSCQQALCHRNDLRSLFGFPKDHLWGPFTLLSLRVRTNLS